MWNHWQVVGFAAILCSYAQAADEPKLADTTERLTIKEESACRQAVYDNGPSTAGRSRENPFSRVLVFPEEIKSLYKAKPQATVRLLLKIVEGGRPWDSIHAVTLIEALVKSPEFAAITAQGSDDKKWDDVIGGSNPKTFREHSRVVCIRLIAEKEKGKADKDKK